MSEETLTVSILREIRDAIGTTNEKLEQTRVDLSSRIDRVRDELGARIDQTNGRLDNVEHSLLELAKQQRFMVRHFKTFAKRDAHLDSEVDNLKHRVDKLESRLGPEP